MTVKQTVARAANFVADVLSSVNLRPFLKKWKIKDKRYGERLVHKLRTQHNLERAPRQQEGGTYTSSQLADAQQVLTEPSRPYHSGAALVQDLKEQEVLPATAKKRGFMPAFKRHLGQLGLALGYGTRTKQQAVTKKDAMARLAWCKKMQPILTEEKVKTWYYEDEKQHGAGGKSRCEWDWEPREAGRLHSAAMVSQHWLALWLWC